MGKTSRRLPLASGDVHRDRVRRAAEWVHASEGEPTLDELQPERDADGLHLASAQELRNPRDVARVERRVDLIEQQHLHRWLRTLPQRELRRDREQLLLPSRERGERAPRLAARPRLHAQLDICRACARRVSVPLGIGEGSRRRARDRGVELEGGIASNAQLPKGLGEPRVGCCERRLERRLPLGLQLDELGAECVRVLARRNPAGVRVLERCDGLGEQLE
mmetsp:Transcript_11029/g.27837  ORF Transcript_11029/g.27837 Transcript_11029/m.27837 type:complete len:221 (+) Transcript_11029:256-918(+)